MSTVSQLCSVMDSLAPLSLAAEWDNVGLLVGRRDRPVTTVLLAIDLTPAVLAEAVSDGSDVVLAYHPPLFTPVKRLDDSSATGRLMLGLIEAGVAVYSPHTALDAAPGGMTDWLMGALGDGSGTPLEHSRTVRPGEANQIVTYVPPDRVDAVRAALAEAGAGVIGAYTFCSTTIENQGTFLGGDTSQPSTGQAGQLERVAERRLMMVCSGDVLADALSALRRAHPYEEPPIHVIPLASHPVPDSGMGRVLHLPRPCSEEDLVSRVKSSLGIDQLRRCRGGRDTHTVVACCPGAGGSLVAAAQAAGATLFLTGEMRHHDVLAARDAGMSVLLAGHTHTERGYLPHWRSRLAALLPTVDFSVSRADETPWSTE